MPPTCLSLTEVGFACRAHCPPLQGRQAYLEKRPPDFSRFKRLP